MFREWQSLEDVYLILLVKQVLIFYLDCVRMMIPGEILSQNEEYCVKNNKGRENNDHFCFRNSITSPDSRRCVHILLSPWTVANAYFFENSMWIGRKCFAQISILEATFIHRYKVVWFVKVWLLSIDFAFSTLENESWISVKGCEVYLLVRFDCNIRFKNNFMAISCSLQFANKERVPWEITWRWNLFSTKYLLWVRIM